MAKGEGINLLDLSELSQRSFYRALVAEFVASLLFLYVTFTTIVGYGEEHHKSETVGLLGISLSFGIMIFILLYCIAGVSGGNIAPSVTFGLLVARKMTLVRAVLYMVVQCLGAIVGVGFVKFFRRNAYMRSGGGTNYVHAGYTVGAAFGAEVITGFLLLYIVFVAIDPKLRATQPPVAPFAPLAIGMAVFAICMTTIPITGTGVDPARSLAAAIFTNDKRAWDDMWIFWVGSYLGAAMAAVYHEYILSDSPAKAREVDGE